MFPLKQTTVTAELVGGRFCGEVVEVPRGTSQVVVRTQRDPVAYVGLSRGTHRGHQWFQHRAGRPNLNLRTLTLREGT